MLRKKDLSVIPKILHFCWLSNDPIPEEYQRYISGWANMMPDFEIKKWDRSAIDFEEHPYVKHAFLAKKYAFAADYIRVFALRKYGGIYLDSDVNVLVSLRKFLGFRYFTAVENNWSKTNYQMLKGRYIDADGCRLPSVDYVMNVGIQAAVLGCEPNHPYIEKLWGIYSALSWDDPQYTAPCIHAKAAESFGFRYRDKLQFLSEDIVVFPSEVFCNGVKGRTVATQAIHCCAGSWLKATDSTFKRWVKMIPLVLDLYNKYVILSRKQVSALNSRF